MLMTSTRSPLGLCFKYILKSLWLTEKLSEQHQSCACRRPVTTLKSGIKKSRAGRGSGYYLAARLLVREHKATIQRLYRAGVGADGIDKALHLVLGHADAALHDIPGDHFIAAGGR